jgi:6-pyruvoyltetrahydropterin/6-carboxytetrahydropterin synthase
VLETFIEFTFEAAHQIPPYSSLHGHSFAVIVYLTGERDPTYGWTHNLYEVEAALAPTKQRLTNSYLNEIPGLEVPTLENVAAWIWDQLAPTLPGLDRVVIRRGTGGAAEGCSYSAGQPAVSNERRFA